MDVTVRYSRQGNGLEAGGASFFNADPGSWKIEPVGKIPEEAAIGLPFPRRFRQINLHSSAPQINPFFFFRPVQTCSLYKRADGSVHSSGEKIPHAQS